MRSQKIYARRTYAPLTVACTLSCSTPLSPYTQLYRDGEWEPDRTLTPCGIRPEVSASASDGTWQNKDNRQLMAGMKWYVDGTDITTLADWRGKYEIVQTGTERGTLLVKRNLPEGESHALSFSCVLPDTRTGQNVPLRSEDVVISTEGVSGDKWGIEVLSDPILPYDVTKDLLLRYDYMKSHGMETQLTEATAKDGNEYLRTVPITVRKGLNAVTEGVTLRMKRTDVAPAVTLTPGRDELVSLSPTGVTIDLRVAPHGATYYCEAVVGNEVVASATMFGVARIHPAVTVLPSNDGDLLDGQTERWDRAVVRLRNSDLTCPELVLGLGWYCDTAYETEHFLGYGQEVKFEMEDLRVGTGTADSWMEVYLDYDYKEEMKALESGGVVMTDGDGSVLVFN